MRSLVIGNGEVGSALAKVLRCDVRDIEPHPGQYDTLHIAFGWFDGAESAVAEYVLEHGASVVVIHSTFPVEAFRRNPGWLCSPVRGRHPDLEEGIRTFTKHLGGKSGIHRVQREFEDAGLFVEVHQTAEELALGKLIELAQMGVEVAMEKEIDRLYRENGLNPEVYKIFADSYNRGYLELGETRFVKPILKHIQGGIGGHCVKQNNPLLDSPNFFNPIVSDVQLNVDKGYWD